MSLGNVDGLSVLGQLKRKLLGVLVESAQHGLFQLSQLLRPLVSQPVKLFAFGQQLLLVLAGAVDLDLEAGDQVEFATTAVLSGDLKLTNIFNLFRIQTFIMFAFPFLGECAWSNKSTVQ
jgi:hypothetical protein